MRYDLSRMAAERPEFDEFFRVFGRRERNASVTELDKFLQTNELALLRDTRGRSLAIEFFRRLEKLGFGQFRVGRRKKPTRFIWGTALTEVAAAAIGQTPREAIAEQPHDNGGPRAGVPKLVAHSYVLRENLTLRLELPVDLTASEAKRLGTFIQTLPLDEGKGE